MVGANVLYLRILNNLRKALSEDIHDSWCGFISHNLRTSIIDDYKVYIAKKLKVSYQEWILDGEEYCKIRSEWQMRTMLHGERMSCFLSIHEILLKIAKPQYMSRVKKILNSLQDFSPDSYSYTLLGRADLVKMPSRLEHYGKFLDELTAISSNKHQ